MTVFVSSIGIARFGRRSEGLVELLAEAGKMALEGAPVRHRAPQAIFVGSMAAGPLAGVENLVPRVAAALGLTEIPGYRIEAASATGAAVFHSAVGAVASQMFDSALVVAGEKMTSCTTQDVTTVLSRSLSPHEILHGATMPSLAALVSSTYLGHYSIPIEQIGRVTVDNRANAAKNPFAHFQKPVTLEEVNTSRMVSTPLRLLHVSAVSDGAAAALITRTGGKVSVAGMGQATDVLDVVSRKDLTGFRATRLAAMRAYESSHLTRKEVGVAEVHDAFAPFELIDIEDLGLCGPGEALGWLDKGHGMLSGSVPVNPSGGLLGRGHPVGVSGLVQIAEVYRQLSGEAGPLQAGHPAVGIAQSVGGLGSHNFVTILRREVAGG
jgi:acetyl-CoA C-acetyltransferase